MLLPQEANAVQHLPRARAGGFEPLLELGVFNFELFHSLGATPGQEFRKLRIPYCLPYLFAALKISSSLSVVLRSRQTSADVAN